MHPDPPPPKKHLKCLISESLKVYDEFMFPRMPRTSSTHCKSFPTYAVSPFTEGFPDHSNGCTDNLFNILPFKL